MIDWQTASEQERSAFIATAVNPGFARYQRGKDILKTCKVITSPRGTVLGANSYRALVEGEPVVVPVILIPAGDVAGSATQRYAALALRKS